MPRLESTESVDKPIVSVIIPNFNGREVLEDCFKSIEALQYPPSRLEVLVVDNGSNDGSQEFVRQNKRFRLIELQRNDGFAAAANLGAKESKGEFIALINNDVELSPDWVQQILKPFLSDPKVGAATGKLLLKDRPDVVNDLGAILLLNGAGLHRGLGLMDRGFDNTALVGAPSGAACVIRKRDFLAVGGFDDTYFAYFEDVDLGWRLWRSGRTVIYVPAAVAYHRWRYTAKRFGNEFTSFHNAKNSFSNLMKNVEAPNLLKGFLLWVLRLLYDAARQLNARDARGIIGIIRSLMWGERNFKVLLIKRQRMGAREVADSELIKLGVLGGLREGIGEVLRNRGSHQVLEQELRLLR